MAPTFGSSGGAQENPGSIFDAIDLTLSSPEPEERPRRPPPQQHPPSFVKTEPRPNLGNRTPAVKTERNAPASTLSRPQQQERLISPQHMAQMIDTTNPRALKSVLLDLCSISPAFSGALARGLAPYSSFAQNLIKENRQVPQQKVAQQKVAKPPVIQESDSDDSEQEYLRWKKYRTVDDQDRARYQMPKTPARLVWSNINTSGPDRRIKPERETSPDGRESLASRHTPAHAHNYQQPMSNRSPLKNITSFQTGVNRTPSSTPRSSNAHQGLKVEPSSDKCTQCHQTIEDELGNCFYHSGYEMIVDGEPVCSDCKESMSDLGCALGIHISEAEARKG